MNKNNMAEIISNSLISIEVHVSEADAIKIAKNIRKPMWNWHIYAGYTLIGLYILRLLYMAFAGAAFKSPFSKESTLREKFESWVYIVFYTFIGISLVTGFLIVNGSKDSKAFLESIHVLSIYYVLSFIALHLGGVLFAELGSQKGIVSRMIHGKYEKH